MTRKLYSLILAASLFLTSVALLPGCSKTDSDEPESGQPSTPTNPNPETPSEKPSIDLTKIDCSGINFTSNVSPYLENGDTYESILEGLKIQIEDPTISVKNVGLRLKGASDFIMTTQLADKMIFSFTLQDLPHGKNELEFVLNLKQDGHKDTEKVFCKKDIYVFNEKPVFEPAFLDVYSVGFMDSSGNPVYLEFYMELKNYTINFSKIFNWSYLDSSGRPVSGLEYLSELKYPVYFGVESNFGAKVVEQKLHWHDIDAEPSDYLPIPETIPHDPYPLFAEITIAGEHENIEINDKSIYIITIE